MIVGAPWSLGFRHLLVFIHAQAYTYTVKGAAAQFLQTEKAVRANISHVHTTHFHSIN